MFTNENELYTLKRKVQQYQEVLENTQAYREVWQNQLRDFIRNQLQSLIDSVGLKASIEERSDMENLQAVVLSLGQERSGMSQRINADLQRHLIKHNGSLVYQQLFNGKVIVLVNYPFIEGYGKPQPPRTIAIYRPNELKEPFFVRHLEELLQEITNWEDYDDDEPNKRIGFKMNFGAEDSPELQP